MRRDKITIINEMLANSADIMEAKAEELVSISEYYRDNCDFDRAFKINTEVTKIMEAVAVIRERLG